ncbi:pilus assembly PilX N-terminal domain-containing protein [Bacillus sp. Marseille-P3661]|uniref:pilus assembly PilX N-terminal domain-containing protein n=1 Tax=Bacillus sp. Marseille-P3661 TaxID=1936234 RepID=UPI000C842F2D|nr:pilus assembly PilX N-terminal domain-containing protein [Bacillus sp. Marseille-P3661]
MKLKEEKGIALVMVLVMITVFTILGITVAGAAINNMKQISTSEKSIQITDIAEMGFTHYITQFTDRYNAEMETIKNNIRTQIIADFEAGNLNSQEHYENNVAIELYNSLSNSDLIKLDGTSVFDLTVNSDPNDGRNFSIFITQFDCTTCYNDPTLFDGDGEIITINFKSEGKMGTDHKSIGATINLKIGKINIQAGGDGGGGDGGGGDGGSTDNPFEHLVDPPPEPVTTGTCPGSNSSLSDGCEYNGSITLNANGPSPSIVNQDVKITGDFISEKNIDGIEGSNLYIGGGVSFGQPIKGIKDSYIYVGGDTDLAVGSTFSNINQGGIQSSTIYIAQGSIQFTQPIEINGSKLYLGDGTNLKNINNLTNSLLVVNSDANFNSPINTFYNSKIYINGDASFHNINGFANNSLICVRGTITGHPGSQYNVYSSTLNSTEYSEYCPSGEIDYEDIFLEWDMENTDISYQYD